MGLGQGLSSSGSLASSFLDRGAVAVVAFLNKVEASAAKQIADDFLTLLPVCSLGTAVSYCRSENLEDRTLSSISLVLFGDPTLAFKRHTPFIDYLVWFESRGNAIWHGPRKKEVELYQLAASYLRTAARYGLEGLVSWRQSGRRM